MKDAPLSKKIEERTQGGHIDDNICYSSYVDTSEFGLIAVRKAATIYSVSRNQIYGSNHHGIHIWKSHVSGELANNVVTGCAQQGILICGDSTIDKNIDGNTVTSGSGSGIAITKRGKS